MAPSCGHSPRNGRCVKIDHGVGLAAKHAGTQLLAPLDESRDRGRPGTEPSSENRPFLVPKNGAVFGTQKWGRRGIRKRRGTQKWDRFWYPEMGPETAPKISPALCPKTLGRRPEDTWNEARTGAFPGPGGPAPARPGLGPGLIPTRPQPNPRRACRSGPHPVLLPFCSPSWTFGSLFARLCTATRPFLEYVEAHPHKTKAYLLLSAGFPSLQL